MEVLGINERQYHELVNEMTEFFWQKRGRMELTTDNILKCFLNL